LGSVSSNAVFQWRTNTFQCVILNAQSLWSLKSCPWRVYSVLDVEIPFCATVIGFLCMFTINLRWVSYCKTWIQYFICCCTIRLKMIMYGFYRKISATSPFSNVIWNELLWYHCFRKNEIVYIISVIDL
jgi:hypothetical protein